MIVGFHLDNVLIYLLQVLYSDERIEIPQWMLSTESVHAKRMNCSLPNVSYCCHDYHVYSLYLCC